MSGPLLFDSTPVVGWRVWLLTDHGDGPELCSVVYQHPWPARRALAMVCEPGGCLGARWPEQPHSCGVHAFKERAEAERFPSTWERRRAGGDSASVYVLGQVSLWGRVVEHEYGFRGQFAYPYELILPPERQWFKSPLASRYGVDVLVQKDRHIE